ncbi:Acyl-coenzyme A synthetase ACSM4, mitochondrial [Nymphon striatum]|nr:Acyl-coenzyme A synthetase ACSM4, mitochondrial [Nymphon striatum]
MTGPYGHRVSVIMCLLFVFIVLCFFSRPCGTEKTPFQRQAIRLCGCNGVDFKGVNLGPKPSKTGFNDYDVGRQECESLKVPEKFNFARDVVDCWAAKESKGERCNSLPAYWYVSSNGNEIKWSFNELSALSKRAANVLEECGIIKGDILLVTLPKVPEWWLLYLASIRIGAIFCTGTSMLTAEDIKYRIETSKSKCVVCNEETFSAVSQGLKFFIRYRPSWINFNDLFYKTSSSQHEFTNHISALVRSTVSLDEHVLNGSFGYSFR